MTRECLTVGPDCALIVLDSAVDHGHTGLPGHRGPGPGGDGGGAQGELLSVAVLVAVVGPSVLVD